MKTFDIKEGITAVCEWEKTRSGFRHVAVLIKNGEEVDRTKVCYLNRMWESYEYESVLIKLLDKTTVLTPQEVRDFFDRQKKHSHDEAVGMLRTVGMVAALGDVLAGDSKKDRNDWKERMIKAGLGEGITMPDDWKSLTEEEKEQRLNAVITIARGD